MPLIKQAEKGEIELYFGDAVHLIHGGNLGYCWCRERVEILTKSGRNRYNVMGCYNYTSNETVTITNNTYITSTEIETILEKLREKNGEKEVYLILDNAKYQKSKLVKKAAEKNHINIVYLPPYSPNLNLIERLWKILRKFCLSNKYHETFEKFCKSIDSFLNETSTTYKNEVTSLLVPKFHIS